MTAGDRARRERDHGRQLIAMGVECAWGWTTAAGRLRAARRAAMIAVAGGLGPGLRVLEIGCGTGIFTETFATSGAHVVAIDVSEELIAIARARALPAERVEFRCIAFEELHSTAGFDAIVGSSVLHHLNLETALPVIRSLLKPGGAIAFAEPNLLNPQVYAERRFRRWFPYVSADETAFARWSLARRLHRSGFVDVVITPFDWLHPRTWPPMIPAVRRLGRFLERVPVAREFAGSLLITGHGKTSEA
jgi:2-polyprenyl-3-methyl-5-hydroxy-6-metoxy-1,4-benzoquinol methylase